MYSHIPRAHAFAYRTPAYIDDFPPWAPALFPQPQTLPTDVVSLDAASSLWIEPEREESCYGSEEFSLSFSQLGIPWLNDTITPAFDATLLAALASDAQLLYCPEQAFADICWAAAVHDVDGDASANLPTPGRRSPTVPDAHPPLADVTNTNTRVEPEPEPPRPVSCALDDEEDDSEDADADADTITPAPPYIASTSSGLRAVEEHNRLLGAPFADFDFAPLRRRDVLHAKGDPTRIDPFPRYLQPNAGGNHLDAAAALLMLQPAPLHAHWQVSGSVGVGVDGLPIGAYPTQTHTHISATPRSTGNTPKTPSRFLAYLTSRPHSPPPPVPV